jgi:hypothetical protein
MEEQVKYEDIALQEDNKGNNSNIEDIRELVDRKDNNE